MKLNNILVLALIVISLSSCSGVDKEFGVLNASGQRLDNVLIESKNGFKFSWGILSSTSYASMLVTTPHPRRDKYILSWDDVNQEKHITEIDLDEALPGGYWGLIVYRINEDFSVDIFLGKDARRKAREK